MLERLVSITISFLVSVWVVRYLGPERYGIYSYALSFSYLFGVFARLGLDNILVRNLTRGEIPVGKILGTALTLRVVAALGAVILIAIIVFTTQDQWIVQIAVLVMSGRLIFEAADVFDHWFQSQILSKYPVLVRSSTLILRAGGQVAFIIAGFPLIAFVALAAGRMILQTLGIFGFYWRMAENRSWTFDFEVAYDMLQDSWPLIISSFSIAIYMKIDQLMIGYMIGSKDVGIYATAVKISELWYFLPMVVASSVFPKIVESRERVSKEKHQRRMQAFYDSMAIVSYVVIIPVVLMADPIVNLLFGSDYQQSAEILSIHIWAFLFVALGVARGRWLISENLTRFTMIAAVLGALVNVSLNYLLIPQFVGIGAAWATLVAQIVATYLSCMLLGEGRRYVFGQLTRAIGFPLRPKHTYRTIMSVLK
jgi:PST family polysaccharide transporter